MRAGFQAEIHNKGWQLSIPGEARKLCRWTRSYEKRGETNGRRVISASVGMASTPQGKRKRDGHDNSNESRQVPRAVKRALRRGIKLAAKKAGRETRQCKADRRCG